MPEIQDKIEASRKAGYTDDQIRNFLIKRPEMEKSRAAGYTDAQIFDHFGLKGPVGDVGRAPPAAGAAGAVSPQTPAAPTRPEPALKPYEPTLREKFSGAVGDVLGGLGMEPHSAQEYGRRAGEAAGLIPGPQQAFGAQEAYRHLKEGQYRKAAGDVLGAIPAVGSAKGGAKAEAAQAAARAAAPATVSKDMRTSVADTLYQNRQAKTADRVEIAKRLEQMPKEALNPQTQERLFRAGEGDPTVQLTPQEQQVFQQHIEPMRQEAATLVEDLKKTGYDVDPEGYMHRMVKGKTRSFDELEGAAATTPYGVGRRSLSKEAPPLHERVYYAIEDAQGNRKLVSLKGETPTVIDKGQSVPLTGAKLGPAHEEFVPGAQFNAGGRDWTIKQALTREIEENTGTKYYKNAFANTAEGLQRLRAAKRNADTLEEIKQSPAFSQFATQAKEAPAGWKESRLPQLRGWKMDPKLANVVDDFLGQERTDLGEKLAQINRFAVGSIFWNPLPHVENVATHWFTGRGWDNFTPQGMKRFGQTMPEAVKEVVTQGPKYQQMLKEGGSLVYGGVAQKNFYEQIAKRTGMDIEARWKDWAPIFQPFGIRHARQAVEWFYDKANRSLWSVGDMFMMQRYLENMKKGMGAKEAIAEAEKHIPNYRIPDEVLGSRAFSELLQNPNITMFSRYHYGMFKSYGEMLKDFYKGSPKEKLDAAGNAFATAVLMGALYPAVDYGLNKLVGTPEGEKGVEKLKRGSATIPQWLIDYYGGEKTFPEIVANSMTMAPSMQIPLELYANKEGFTGRHIVTEEPGPRAAAQATGYLAGKMANPVQVADQIRRAAKEEGFEKALVRVLGRQALGVKAPTAGAEAGRKRAQLKAMRENLRRRGMPANLIESLFNEFAPEYGGTGD